MYIILPDNPSRDYEDYGMVRILDKKNCETFPGITFVANWVGVSRYTFGPDTTH